MSQYTKSCNTCKQQIEMSDRNAGKWLPFNLDGTLHTCRGNGTGTGTKKVMTVEERLKRLEDIVLDPRK